MRRAGESTGRRVRLRASMISVRRSSMPCLSTTISDRHPRRGWAALAGIVDGRRESRRVLGLGVAGRRSLHRSECPGGKGRAAGHLDRLAGDRVVKPHGRTDNPDRTTGWEFSGFGVLTRREFERASPMDCGESPARNGRGANCRIDGRWTALVVGGRPVGSERTAIFVGIIVQCSLLSRG